VISGRVKILVLERNSISSQTVDWELTVEEAMDLSIDRLRNDWNT
jgi:hypothetical protein